MSFISETLQQAERSMKGTQQEVCLICISDPSDETTEASIRAPAVPPHHLQAVISDEQKEAQRWKAGVSFLLINVKGTLVFKAISYFTTNGELSLKVTFTVSPASRLCAEHAVNIDLLICLWEKEKTKGFTKMCECVYL